MTNSHMDLIPKTGIVNLPAATAALLGGADLANNIALNQLAAGNEPSRNEPKTLQSEVERLNQSGVNPAFLASLQEKDKYTPAGESRAARRQSQSTEDLTALAVNIAGESLYVVRASFNELMHLAMKMPRTKDGLLDSERPDEVTRFCALVLYYGLMVLPDGVTVEEEAQVSKKHLVRYFANQDEAFKFADDERQSNFVLDAVLVIDGVNGILPRKPAPEAEVKTPAPRKTRRKGAAKIVAQAKAKEGSEVAREDSNDPFSFENCKAGFNRVIDEANVARMIAAEGSQ